MANQPKQKAPSRKRQHVVPKFYLDRFSDGSGFVAAYDKITDRKHKRISTKNVTVESNFYTLEDVSRDDIYFYEEALGLLETASSEVIRDVVRHRTVDFGDHASRLNVRRTLSLFIRFQILRSHRYRDHIEVTADEYIRHQGVNELIDRGPPAWLKDGRRYYDALYSYLSGEERLVADRDTMLSVLFSVGEQLTSRLVTDFRWILVNNRYSSNITTDFPIGCLSMDDIDGDLWELGIDNIANVWLPLDPAFALLLTKARNGQTGYLVGDPEKLERWNEILRRRAHRWVIWRGSSAANPIDIH